MFALRLNEILQWIDQDSAGLQDPSALRDGFRAHIVRLTRDFLAFPHCENFALMPENDERGNADGDDKSKGAASHAAHSHHKGRKRTTSDIVHEEDEDLLLLP